MESKVLLGVALVSVALAMSCANRASETEPVSEEEKAAWLTQGEPETVAFKLFCIEPKGRKLGHAIVRGIAQALDNAENQRPKEQ